MDSVTFRDLLHADPRPTCIFDAHTVTGVDDSNTAAITPVFTNHALQSSSKSHLLRDISDTEQGHGGSQSLRSWITNADQGASSSYSECLEGRSVFGYTVKQRWRVLQWLDVDQGISQHKRAITNTSSKEDTASHFAGQEVSRTEQHTDRNGDDNETPFDRDSATTRLASMHTTIEMIDVGYFEYDTDARLIKANESFYKLSGHPRVNSAGFSWLDCVFEEDRHWLMDHWLALADGRSTTFEMRWKRPAEAMPNGEEDIEGQWVTAACLPVKNEAGETVSICGCITDIASQKRSESDALKKAEALERAQASERRFTRFADEANVGIYIVDLDMKTSLTPALMLYCNIAWNTITGHPVVKFEDIEWPRLVVDEDLAIVTEHWERMIETRQASTFQFRLKKPWINPLGGKGPTWAICHIYPELNKDASVATVAGHLTDVSHLKWAEIEQKQRTDQAIEAKRQQENFIDMTCHEIRNPLGAVMHCADLIESAMAEMAELLKTSVTSLPDAIRIPYEGLSRSSAEAVNTIISCSTHQKRIMDDILTLSKLDSKLLNIVPSRSRVGEILDTAKRMFEVDAQKVDVALRVVEEPSNGALDVDYVMLDAGRLMQVLINLLTNALKFTQTEATRTVTLSMKVSRTKFSERDLGIEYVPLSTVRDRSHEATKKGNGPIVYLYFKVSDTGCGFDHDQKLVIFERFAQASPRTHSKYGGSGLGLFITRELIELQGGEIGVSSRPGEGSTFAFYIAAPVASPPGVKQYSNGTLSSTPFTDRQRSAVNYTILVVEDNKINQKVLQKQLVKLGHEVFVVSNGEEALTFLETASCWKGNTASSIHLSVVLMDVEMPIMDGITCTRGIRAAEARGDIIRHLPVIAVSANARHEQVDFAMECGMDDAISKPFRIVELIPKIEQLCIQYGMGVIRENDTRMVNVPPHTLHL